MDIGARKKNGKKNCLTNATVVRRRPQRSCNPSGSAISRRSRNMFVPVLGGFASLGLGAEGFNLDLDYGARVWRRWRSVRIVCTEYRYIIEEIWHQVLNARHVLYSTSTVQYVRLYVLRTMAWNPQVEQAIGRWPSLAHPRPS